MSEVYDDQISLIDVRGYPQAPLPKHLGEIKICNTIIINAVRISIGAMVNIGDHVSVLFIGFMMVQTLPKWVNAIFFFLFLFFFFFFSFCFFSFFLFFLFFFSGWLGGWE